MRITFITYAHTANILLQPFTVIMPIRGTLAEMQAVKKSIPAIINLNPHEIFFGVDNPVPIGLEDNIRKICAMHKNFKQIKFITADHSGQKWNMNLAAILYNCFLQTKTENALLLDCDMIIMPEAIIAPDTIETNNVAIYSGYCLFKGASRRFKLHMSLQKIKHTGLLSGCMLVRIPFIINAIDKKKYAEIYNGCDTYLHEAVIGAGYAVVSIPKYTHSVAGGPTMLLPGVAYTRGIWSYANKKALMKKDKLNGMRRIWAFLVLRFPLLAFIKRVLIGESIWYLRGLKFAKNNPNDNAVITAMESTDVEWTYVGSKLIINHHAWKHKSAGFN